ncbi:VOC family protein [Pseudomonas sp. NFX15]|uniref:VOC family protein n=1 Tax=Pseudomonas sp. NFX15 TaxID=2816958 RepID=UPI003B8B485B
MDQRVNMIMVGVTDIAILREFYEHGLGWVPLGQTPSATSVMYKIGQSVLVLMPAEYLFAESGITAANAPKSVWATFVSSKSEVDTQFAKAIKAGATVTSAVRERDGGLYSGYFADPEGNGWELVWSPHLQIDTEGAFVLN